MTRLPARLLQETSGAAALEMALWLTLLVVPMANVVDIGFYVFKRMQVETAVQAGVQAAWASCVAYTAQPKGAACGSTMTTAINTAVASTSLGSSVTVVSGYPTEGPYCPDASGVLQSVASYKMSCASAGYPAGTAGDYIRLRVTYSYTPLFSGASVTSLLPTPIARDAWIRLG